MHTRPVSKPVKLGTKMVEFDRIIAYIVITEQFVMSATKGSGLKRKSDRIDKIFHAVCR